MTVMAIFVVYLKARMVNFPLIIKVNDRQYQFEVHISVNMAKIANFQPRIGQDATFATILNGTTRPFLFDFDI